MLKRNSKVKVELQAHAFAPKGVDGGGTCVECSLGQKAHDAKLGRRTPLQIEVNCLYMDWPTPSEDAPVQFKRLAAVSGSAVPVGYGASTHDDCDCELCR